MRAGYLLLTLLPCALPAQRPLSPFERDKAAAIIRDQLPCLGCHELNGDGGRSAPSLTTVGQRRSAAYIRAMIEDPQRVVPQSGMPKPMMRASVRELVIRYISADAPIGAPPAIPPAPRAYPIPAESQYQRWCAACHGHNGGGDGPNARFLPVRPAVHQSAPAMSGRSDDALFDAISGGGLVMGKSARMPAFGQTLSGADIRGLVTYIRQLCDCTGPAWSRDGTRRSTKP